MPFLTFLDNNENTRKIFGKRELVIIRKQLLGVALSQSEKNRLSRDIRKKLEFVKDAAKFSDEFALKKGTVVKQKIQETKNLILNNTLGHTVRSITVFGSTATNERTVFSDIDFAVDLGKISVKAGTKFRIRVLGQTDDNIDVQVTELLPEKIRKDIAKHGKVIYSCASKKRLKKLNNSSTN